MTAQLEQGTETVSAHHQWVWMDGNMVSAEEASVSVTTQAFNYGTAVFEGIRAYRDNRTGQLNVFRLRDHIERLLNSARLLMINDLPSRQAIENSILELLVKNEANQDCYIRPIAFKKNLLPKMGFGVKLSGISTGFSVNSLNMPSRQSAQGISCSVSAWRRVPDTAIPVRAKITGSYVNSALAMETAMNGGHDDAIMLNIHGCVSEATTSNIFIVKNERLITPPLHAHILDGITRNTVIQLAGAYLNCDIEERDILPSELYAADECFLTGTGREISPVRKIDQYELNSDQESSLTLKLKSLYMKAVRGEMNDFGHWLTAVGSRDI